jgi:hypothetical protein
METPMDIVIDEEIKFEVITETGVQRQDLISIKRKCLSISVTLSNMLVESLSTGSCDFRISIPVHEIAFIQVKDYLENIYPNLSENEKKVAQKPLLDKSEKISQREYDFIRGVDVQSPDKKTLITLLEAANYLDIAPLLYLVARHIVSHIKGKTPDEIRKSFGMLNNWTPEAYAKAVEQLNGTFSPSDSSTENKASQ